MSEIKITFRDVDGKVIIELEGDIPEDTINISNAQYLAMKTVETIQLQNVINQMEQEKSLTNTEEDDKTKYRN